jgi:pyruvate dehydrogenase E1 component alpha subunit
MEPSNDHASPSASRSDGAAAPSALASRDAAEEDRDVRLLRTMVLIRRFEERCVELYSASQIRGFMHLCIGEEAIAAGVMDALRPEDTVVSTYREHGHALARGVSPRSIMAEMFGKQEGCSGGRGGSMHLFDTDRGFYGGNAIVGGGLPLAVGLALATKLTGASSVAACFFGDGAVAEGEFHECLNLAALWELPVLFCCENNRYAMGTALARAQAETDLALRAASYGIAAWSVDGMDAQEVADASERAAMALRGGGGPVFLELQTYRFRAHSMYDPDRYRDKAEIDRWKLRDPIEHAVDQLEATGFPAAQLLEEIEEQVRRTLDDAVAFAEQGTLEPVDGVLRHVLHGSGDRR